MKTAQEIRDKVSADYTKAVTGDCCATTKSIPETQSPDQPCCGWAADAAMPASSASQQTASCCSGGDATTLMDEKNNDITAKCAGYTDDVLGDLPSNAVENSLGCGNPVAFSEVQPGQTVVDLGSGAGIDLLVAAKKVGPGGKVIGIDMTDAMIERARINIKEAGVDDFVEVRKGIIEELPIEDNSVDWVISNCVINLSPEKERVFAEIARVLKPGGCMLVSDIVAQKIPDALRAHAAAHSACLSGAISEAEYLSALHEAGMENAEVRARIRYSPEQVISFTRSECCESGGWPVGVDRDQLAAELAENIWSANVFAQKNSE